MTVPHPSLLKLVERNDFVPLTTGTYEEVTNIVDQANGVIKFKKNDFWTSIPLLSKHSTVKGFKQAFGRIYDVEQDVFAFLTIEDDITLDVREILERPCRLWDGKSDLTQLDVINIINMAIDTVISLFGVLHGYIA